MKYIFSFFHIAISPELVIAELPTNCIYHSFTIQHERNPWSKWSVSLDYRHCTSIVPRMPGTVNNEGSCGLSSWIVHLTPFLTILTVRICSANEVGEQQTSSQVRLDVIESLSGFCTVYEQNIVQIGEVQTTTTTTTTTITTQETDATESVIGATTTGLATESATSPGISITSAQAAGTIISASLIGGIVAATLVMVVVFALGFVCLCKKGRNKRESSYSPDLESHEGTPPPQTAPGTALSPCSQRELVAVQ